MGGDVHVVHVPLEVLPVVGAHRASALGEVDLLVWIRVVEGVLVVDAAAVAMEGNTGECVGSLLHL